MTSATTKKTKKADKTTSLVWEKVVGARSLIRRHFARTWGKNISIV
jgi:hypothetical protein